MVGDALEGVIAAVVPNTVGGVELGVSIGVVSVLVGVVVVSVGVVVVSVGVVVVSVGVVVVSDGVVAGVVCVHSHVLGGGEAGVVGVSQAFGQAGTIVELN